MYLCFYIVMMISLETPYKFMPSDTTDNSIRQLTHRHDSSVVMSRVLHRYSLATKARIATTQQRHFMYMWHTYLRSKHATTRRMHSNVTGIGRLQSKLRITNNRE